MTQEEKQLLTKDIFGRVLTGIKVDYKGQAFTLGYNLCLEEGNVAFESYPMKFYLEGIETIKPYLRPMSSMTEKEKDEFDKLMNLVEERCINAYGKGGYTLAFTELNDWLNAHHFDYRGLIKNGLALEAPEDMYKTE